MILQINGGNMLELFWRRRAYGRGPIEPRLISSAGMLRARTVCAGCGNPSHSDPAPA